MDEDQARLNLMIPKKLKKDLKLYVAKNDSTIQEVVIKAVEKEIKK